MGEPHRSTPIRQWLNGAPKLDRAVTAKGSPRSLGAAQRVHPRREKPIKPQLPEGKCQWAHHVDTIAA